MGSPRVGPGSAAWPGHRLVQQGKQLRGVGQTGDGHCPPMTKGPARAGLDLGFRVRAQPPALGRNQEEVRGGGVLAGK